MKIKSKILILLFLLPLVAVAEQSQQQFLTAYIVGNYHLIGKSLNSENTYYGKVKLQPTKTGLEVTRIIKGSKIIGFGAIETATADKANVLKIRFTEKNIIYEETCMIDGDLDNYARITCHLYQPKIKTNNPGLESLFVDHGRN